MRADILYTRMVKLIDLTHTFGKQMPVYPGDALPELRQIAVVGKDDFTDHQLTTGMHVGTHMDAPWHMLEGGERLSEISVERFFGRGRLIDARGASKVDADRLNGVPLQKGNVVIVMTGWGEKFRDPDYYTQYPELSEGFAEALVRAGVSIVGMDTPSPDRPPFRVHKILLGAGVLIIENLTNLDRLIDVPQFDVIALPMKLDTDAGPVRVVARVGE